MLNTKARKTKHRQASAETWVRPQQSRRHGSNNRYRDSTWLLSRRQKEGKDVTQARWVKVKERDVDSSAHCRTVASVGSAEALGTETL